MRYGYKRPLIDDENGEKQLVHIPVDRLFTEKHARPKKRTALEDLLMAVEEGDQIFVENIVVIADSFHQMIDILRVIEKDKATIYFQAEQLKSDEINTFSLIQLASWAAATQSAIARHVSTFALAEAKKSGKAIGRPKKSDENLKRALAMYEGKQHTLMDIKNETGISKSTLYRYLEQISSQE